VQGVERCFVALISAAVRTPAKLQLQRKKAIPSDGRMCKSRRNRCWERSPQIPRMKKPPALRCWRLQSKS